MVASAPPGGITTVVVAVPARNEQALIERCLASIEVAALRCGRPVVIAVAADSCHDATATTVRLAASMMRTKVVVVEGSWRAAGRARAAAVRAALGTVGDVDPLLTWIANTDADCVVPPDWLRHQGAHADAGAHAVAGIVDLDPASTPAKLMARFRATYRVNGTTHPHVHGANLGVRVDAYEAVGGWGTHVMVGEDHELIRRLRAAGLIVRAVADKPVITSSRTTGRMPAGFANRLAQLSGRRRLGRSSRRAMTARAS